MTWESKSQKSDERDVARFTIWHRSSSPIPLVIVKNTGIVPRKLVKVKKEVKHSYAKGNSVSIKVWFFRLWIKVLYYWEMDNKVLQYFTLIKNKTMQTTTTDSKLLNFLLIFLHYLPENNTWKERKSRISCKWNNQFTKKWRETF